VSRLVRVALNPLVEGEFELDPGSRHYLCQVHRLKVGDRFLGFDPEGRIEADAELVRVRGRGATCRLGATRPASLISPLRVTLLQALGKGDKVDQVVRDATALGVGRLVVVHTARSVVRLSQNAPRRHQRWRAIALDAARQSGRGDLPAITGPIPWGEALALAQEEGRHLCLHAASTQGLVAALAGWHGGLPVSVLIGPEGGFSADELEGVRRAGYEPASLGPLTLRTETAATAVLGALSALSGWTVPACLEGHTPCRHSDT
jgi:16S rRNA (uracil1498-N3)-methyltransferase